MNLRISTRMLISAIGLILLIPLVLWLWIYNGFDPAIQQANRSAMLLEASKFLAQLVVIVVLGGIVTILFNWYAKQQDDRQRAREKEQEQRKLQLDEDNALRRKLLASLIDVRAQVEKARREFRLLPPEEKKAGYRTAIEAVLVARLRLSQVWQDTETWNQLYLPQDRVDIHERLEKMKDYLDGLIEEYENSTADSKDRDDKKSVEKLMMLSFERFVAGNGGPLYRTGFLINYQMVAQTIRLSILNSGKQITSDESSVDQPVRVEALRSIVKII